MEFSLLNEYIRYVSDSVYNNGPWAIALTLLFALISGIFVSKWVNVVLRRRKGLYNVHVDCMAHGIIWSHIFEHAASYTRTKICNTCEEPITDGTELECSVCEFFTHEKCVEKSMLSTCKQGAVKSDVFLHQWLPHNIPRFAKCSVCGKRCDEDASVERCVWCKCTQHKGCQSKDEVCNGGKFRGV
eukprot:Colp12_sorted_trinity150504_noHs@9137